MRFLAIVPSLIVLISAAPKDDFLSKFMKTVTFWPASNLGKITDAVMNDICAGKSMEEIGKKAFGYLQSNTPITKLPTLLGMLTTCNKCLDGKKTKTNTLDLFSKASPVFMNQLKGPYNTIKAKCETMTKNGKTASQKLNQGYTLASASVTDNLIQKIITNSAGKMSANEWGCAISILPKVVDIKRFNTAKSG